MQPIGLGARDSCGWRPGFASTGMTWTKRSVPMEAGLVWSIQKRRRNEGGFPGADRIKPNCPTAPARVRIGIKPEGRAPAREGTEILSASGETSAS